MTFLTRHYERSPLLARVLPFVIFVLLTFGQGQFGEGSRYWFYCAKTLVGAWLVWSMRPFVRELRWALSTEAVVAGVGVFVLWVGIDSLYPGLDEIHARWLGPWLTRLGVGSGEASPPATPWNPFVHFSASPALAWLIIVTRIVGSTLVVPPLEEVFYRSFLYRYLASPEFERVALGQWLWKPFLLTAVIFGLAHQQWLAGILCGFVYQGLVCRRQRLGDAVTAHAITNFLLGLWVVWRDAWHFW
ncbi:MAG TPA: CAAX prenyl protease-related protein [Methylomirabilota bacterium]|nr:CAAX prenyl protease-related protein [Methylomirabilota bacterium]